MGSGVAMQCDHCGWSGDFPLGIGMLYSDLDHVIGQLSKTKRAEVDEVRHKHRIERSEFMREMFVCRTCHALAGRLWVRLVYDGGKVYETVYACRKCRRPMEIAAEQEEFPCPKCGAKPLRQLLMPLWD